LIARRPLGAPRRRWAMRALAIAGAFIGVAA